MRLLRPLRAHAYALLLLGFVSMLAACEAGSKAPDETALAAPAATPQRPAADEASRWVRDEMPGALSLEPSLEAFPALRISAFAFRGALAMLAYEDGELLAYPSSAIAARSGEALGTTSDASAAAPTLPPPIWKIKLGFAADRLLALPDALIAALDADSGRLLLLSGADGSILGEVQAGKGSRFAPAWTSGYLAFATDEALEIVRTITPASVARVPLAARAASSLYSALGRFALLLEDGSLIVADAASATLLWSAQGLDPRGGLACDGEAWYALDSGGKPRAFALSDGAILAAPGMESGSFRSIHSVSAEGLHLMASAGTSILLRRESGAPSESSAPLAAGASAEEAGRDVEFNSLFAPAQSIVSSLEAALDKYLHRDASPGGNYLSFAPWVEGSVAGGWGQPAGAEAAPAFIAYRYKPEGSGERGLSYRAPDEREILLAVFSEDGNELASNVGEMVERDSLRLPFEAGRLYWIVAGSLERSRGPGAASVHIE